MEAIFIGICTLTGIGLGVGVTRLGLGFLIDLIPSRHDVTAEQQPEA
jgi:hypothetical protein